jgi:transposase
VNTISTTPSARRRRRKHSDEFKADSVAAAAQPGVSMASVALARGINANLLRRWVQEAELSPGRVVPKTAVSATFVPMRLPPAAAGGGEIRIDVRRGATTITVAWPVAAAAECANWMRELLR